MSFLIDRENARGMEDRILAHLFVGIESHAADDTLLPRDMDGGVGENAVGLLVPLQQRSIELFTFAIERVYIPAQRPYLQVLVVMGIIGFERSLHRQIGIELLHIYPVRELLIGRVGLVIDQPLRCLDAIAGDAGVRDQRTHAVCTQRRYLFARHTLAVLDNSAIRTGIKKHSEYHRDTRYENLIG